MFLVRFENEGVKVADESLENLVRAQYQCILRRFTCSFVNDLDLD